MRGGPRILVDSPLELTPRQEKASDRFRLAYIQGRKQGRIPCDDRPDLFADYDEEHIPTRFQARMLCQGCPLLTNGECQRYAEAMHPDWGVWASRVYTEGGTK